MLKNLFYLYPISQICNPFIKQMKFHMVCIIDRGCPCPFHNPIPILHCKIPISNPPIPNSKVFQITIYHPYTTPENHDIRIPDPLNLKLHIVVAQGLLLPELPSGEVWACGIGLIGGVKGLECCNLTGMDGGEEEHEVHDESTIKDS